MQLLEVFSELQPVVQAGQRIRPRLLRQDLPVMRQIGVQRGHPHGHQQARMQDEGVQRLGDVVIRPGFKPGEHIVLGPMGRRQ